MKIGMNDPNIFGSIVQEKVICNVEGCLMAFDSKIDMLIHCVSHVS